MQGRDNRCAVIVETNPAVFAKKVTDILDLKDANRSWRVSYTHIAEVGTTITYRAVLVERFHE